MTMNFNFKKLFTFIFSGFAVFALSAQELLRNGSFEDGLSHWKITGKYSLDTSDKTAGKQSLKITKGYFDEIWQFAEVKPDTEYELTYYLKCTDLKCRGKKGVFGVSVSIAGDKKRKVYGRNGAWKFDNGTFDWTPVTIHFNTSEFGNPAKLRIAIQCPNAVGTFRVDGVSLRKKLNRPYHITIFPFKFMKKGSVYTIGENLIGTIFACGAREDKKPYTGKQYPYGTPAKMILELPEFLRFIGSVERFYMVKRPGCPERTPFTEKAIMKNGERYRQYTITFNPLFAANLKSKSYREKLFLVPEKGSAGKKGRIFWSFDIGGDIQKEESFPVAVYPPILPKAPPCKRFSLTVGYSSIHISPFLEWRPVMTRFWKGLALRPITQLEWGEGGKDPEFDVQCVLLDDDAFPDTKYGRSAYQVYKRKAPKTLDINGKPGQSPTWYKLDDPDKHYENFLRKALRDALKVHPEITAFKWDFEPFHMGYDAEGRKRFAESLHLKHTPEIAEIKKKYARQWNLYQYRMNAKLISKVCAIIKSEAPDRKVILTSTEAMPGYEGGWCDVDMRLVANDPSIDKFAGMPYYIGTFFFDTIHLNTSIFKKPMSFAQDPSERIWHFFRKYTPERLYQNILAIAALGGCGLSLWPEDSMVAEYYQTVVDVFSVISKYENVFFDGKRVDKDFQLIPQNVVTKTIGDGDKKVPIQFPHFKSSLRMTAHEYKGKYYITVFNYNEKSEVILRIKGHGYDFLALIPKCGAKVIEAAAPENQIALRNKLELFRKAGGKDSFDDQSDGKTSIAWKLDKNNKPVLRLSNAVFSADIDALFSGDIVGFRKNSGANLFDDAAAGRIILHDENQPPFFFQVKSAVLKNGTASVVSETEIPAYEGAMEAVNPLLGLKITRTYQLTPDGLRVSFRLTNPTENSMKFSFRLWNFPQTGKRFGYQNQEMKVGSKKITLMSDENNSFMKKGQKLPSVFSSKHKIYEWKGEALLSSAQAGPLKDAAEFIPDAKFAGVYIWNSSSSKRGQTVEFIAPEITLRPHASVEYSYRIS